MNMRRKKKEKKRAGGKKKKKITFTPVTVTHTHTHTFTLCLCGLGEPAKLPFLLLSEVSQRDPLVLPTCSSHSQTAEEAVSQYTAEGEERRREERAARDSCNTNYSTDTATMSREATEQVCRTESTILLAQKNLSLDYVVLLQQKKNNNNPAYSLLA